MSVDYLLTKFQQDSYEEQLEINENSRLPNNVEIELIAKFLCREDSIDYIFYDGKNGSNSKYSLFEFMEEMKTIVPMPPLWPIMVALSGAGVVWKST